jgi:hypothetical protein
MKNGGIVTLVSSDFTKIIGFPYDHKDLITNQTFLETELVFPRGTVNANIILSLANI